MVIFHPPSFSLTPPPCITSPNLFSPFANQKEKDDIQSPKDALASQTLVGKEDVLTPSTSDPIKDPSLIPNLSENVALLLCSAVDEFWKLFKAIDLRAQEKNKFILCLKSDLEVEKKKSKDHAIKYNEAATLHNR